MEPTENTAVYLLQNSFNLWGILSIRRGIKQDKRRKQLVLCFNKPFQSLHFERGAFWLTVDQSIKLSHRLTSVERHEKGRPCPKNDYRALKSAKRKEDWLAAADWTTRKVWRSENTNREVEKFSHWKVGLFLEKQGLEAPQVNSACRRGHAAWLRSHLRATDPVRPVLTWFLSHWGRCRTALQMGTKTSWRQDYSAKFTSTGDVIFLTQ